MKTSETARDTAQRETVLATGQDRQTDTLSVRSNGVASGKLSTLRMAAMNQSPRMKAHLAMQTAIEQSPRMQEQRAQQALIGQSPRSLARRLARQATFNGMPYYLPDMLGDPDGPTIVALEPLASAADGPEQAATGSGARGGLHDEVREGAEAGVLAPRRETAPSNPQPMDLLGDLARQMMVDFLSKHSLTALLNFADETARQALMSFKTFEKIYGAAVKFTDALSLALNIWERFPAPIRTGILFLVGKVMRMIPFVDALSYTEAHIVDADKDVKSTYLVWALEKFKLVLRAVANPASSALYLGKYVYDTWWHGGGSATTDTGKAVSNMLGYKRDSLAKLDLKIVWLDVKALHLEKTEKDGAGERTREGGLHADFAFGVNMFDHSFSLGEKKGLTLILPWSGGAILRSEDTVNIIKQFSVPDLFDIQQLDMTLLEVSNEGLQTLVFSLQKLGLARDAVTMNATNAHYKKGVGMNFDGRMKLQIYGWEADARLGLALDATGRFKEGKVEGFKESSGAVTVASASLSRENGFAIRDAALDLKPSTGLDLKGTLKALDIKQDAVAGAAEIKASDIPLLGDKVTLTQAGGTAAYRARNDWGLSANAGLAMSFSNVTASGMFSISHESKTGVTDLRLKEGQFAAEYDGVSVTAKGMSYIHAQRTFTLSKAEVDIKAIKSKVEIEGVTINEEGLDFKKARMVYLDPIKPFSGLVITKPQFMLEKNGDGFKASALADLDVAIDNPLVKAEAIGVGVSFDKHGLHGELASLEMHTTPFDLKLEKARLSSDQLSVDTAKITFNKDDDSADKDSHQMIPGLMQGLLDFIPVGTALTASEVVINKDGFKVGSFKPDIEAIKFQAFGIGGELDLANLKAKMSAEKQLTLSEMTGLPLKAEVFFPVLPGLEIYGSLAAAANLGAAFDLNAGAQSRHWAVGGDVKVNAGIKLTAEIGAQAGSQALLAVSAGAFATGEAKLTNAGAAIAGKVRYDRATRKFVVIEPLHVNYDFGANAIVSIGGVIKAKALYFYEYKIYQFTAKQWTLGEYKLAGKLGDAAGELAPEKATALGLAEGKARPAPDEAPQTSAVDQTLRSGELIHNSAEARRNLLRADADKASEQLRKLHAAGQGERKTLGQIEAKYIQVLSKKDHLFRAMVDTMSDVAMNEKLLAFNAKYGVERLQTKYSEHMDKLDAVEKRIDAALETLRKLPSTSLDKLEHGMKDEVDTLNTEQAKAAATTIPDSAPLDAAVASLDAALSDEAARQKLTLDTLNSVMSPADFLGNTTTSGFFGETKRKTIVPVDEALAAYHQARSRDTLLALQKQVETYLSSSSSQRVPYVLLLQSQVVEALKVAG